MLEPIKQNDWVLSADPAPPATRGLCWSLHHCTVRCHEFVHLAPLQWLSSLFVLGGERTDRTFSFYFGLSEPSTRLTNRKCTRKAYWESAFLSEWGMTSILHSVGSDRG